MKDFLATTKALSDPSRVRALMALTGGELCVCQLIELLALAPSTVSKHMAILHQAGLVVTRKEGRWVYYRLPGSPDPAVRATLTWAKGSLKKDPRVVADAKRIGKVRKMNKEALCATYSR
jgi:ArsR family transcriptional regulator, arsenate/arsenite/antimonite-responsive transcriptional repressor